MVIHIGPLEGTILDGFPISPLEISLLSMGIGWISNNQDFMYWGMAIYQSFFISSPNLPKNHKEENNTYKPILKRDGKK